MVTSGLNPETIDKYRQVSIDCHPNGGTQGIVQVAQGLPCVTCTLILLLVFFFYKLCDIST